MKPELVQRNETVTIIYEVPGIVLTMRGKAQEAGAEGDVISVLNVQSKRTVQGTVIRSRPRHRHRRNRARRRQRARVKLSELRRPEASSKRHSDDSQMSFQRLLVMRRPLARLRRC